MHRVLRSAATKAHKSSALRSVRFMSTDPTYTKFSDNKPTIEYAKVMPSSYAEMKHENIIQLCVEGSCGARVEALTRHIMAVDDVSYEEAKETLKEMDKIVHELMHLEYVPYHLGIGTAVVTGTAAFPLIFHRGTAEWFNEKFVTAEVPEAADLETIWEVGGWTWGWMEPAIGQASFALLVLQFARSQMMKLGIKPYGNWMISRRSKRLVAMFPQYNTMFLEWFAESHSMYGNNPLHDD